MTVSERNMSLTPCVWSSSGLLDIFVHRDTHWCHPIGVSHWGHAQHLQELRGCSGSYLYKESPSVDVSPPTGIGKVWGQVGKHLNKVEVARREATGEKSPELEMIPQMILAYRRGNLISKHMIPVVPLSFIKII